MMHLKTTSYTLWFNDLKDRFYLLPKEHILLSGSDILYNIEGQKKHCSSEQINQFSCSKEEAVQYFRNQWNEALNEAKKSWMELYKFSHLLGIDYTKESFKTDFLTGLEKSGVTTNQAFDFGKSFVEQLQQAVKGGDLQDKETQQEAFKKIFKNLPDILSSFEKDKLEAAVNNPEAWANELYQKTFGDEEKKKIEKRKEQLKNDVRASIAEGLRKAGIKPAEDFDKTT